MSSGLTPKAEALLPGMGYRPKPPATHGRDAASTSAVPTACAAAGQEGTRSAGGKRKRSRAADSYVNEDEDEDEEELEWEKPTPGRLTERQQLSLALRESMV